jgi:hypothetical protein
VARRDAVWAASYGVAFASVMGPLLGTKERTEPTSLLEQAFEKTERFKSVVAAADAHARKVAQLAAEASDEREPR